MPLTAFTLTLIFTGSIFVIAGICLAVFPPKKINTMYGYRTKASMRNQQTWNVANRYSAKIMLITGSVLVIIALFSLKIQFLRNLNVLISTGLTIVSALCMLMLTESHLKKMFDENGNRKT